MARLVTYVDVDGWAQDTVSVSARLELETDDGRRVLLLDDRGWGTTAAWSRTSVAELEDTARTVVGPDEPFDDRTQEDMAADHWGSLQQTAQRAGVVLDGGRLRQLPHHVVLSPQVLARLTGR